jgi:hypothetical protein
MIPQTAKDWNRFSKWMMALAFVFVVMGAGFAIHTHLFLKRAVPATGTIVKLVESNGDDGETLYAPIFTFADARGNAYKIHSSTATHPAIGEVGDKINILYDPSNPEKAEINRFLHLWGTAIIPAGLGTFYFILFWVVAFFTKRKMKSANKFGSVGRDTAAKP